MAQLFKVDVKAKVTIKLVGDFDKILPELQSYMDIIMPVYQALSPDKQAELRQHNYILNTILKLAGVD